MNSPSSPMADKKFIGRIVLKLIRFTLQEVYFGGVGATWGNLLVNTCTVMSFSSFALFTIAE